MIDLYEENVNHILYLGLNMLRLVSCFLLLPLFSREAMPSLVRNSMFVSLSLITLFVSYNVPPPIIAPADWISVFTAEIFIGMVLGVFIGSFLWAFEAAGFIIDTQVGTGQAMIYDPLAGHEVTLNGEFLSRFAVYIFVSVGGLSMIIRLLYGSYLVYPVGIDLSDLDLASFQLLVTHLQSIFGIIFMVAAPTLLVLFMIDLIFATLNRFAQQVNAQFISNSVKSVAASLVLFLTIYLIGDVIVGKMQGQFGNVPNVLKQLWLPSS